ncbi:hypothetical protein C4577_04060 [Candidatus Parcubacteria bacterium]|nr:MAG: hypothetical protein C4577_04060 [Candidatus Parcubacteria bacterium]
MPAKNTIKIYIPNGYYHIYNRGVEKRVIFQDDADYKMFLYYMFIYLAPPSVIQSRYEKLKSALKLGNFYSKVDLLCYTLMPNHFHFLVHQNSEKHITELMRRITNAYTTYFNKRYDRVGPLFQGVYKASLIDRDEYLLYLTRYIHRNSLDVIDYKNKIENYPWSSYRAYLGFEKSSYINTSFVLNFFSQKNEFLSYKSFVEFEQQYQLPQNILFDE